MSSPLPPPPKDEASPLAALAATEQGPGDDNNAATTAAYSSAACAAAPSQSERRRSTILGGGAALAAAALYGFQRANPVNPAALLRLMEERSPTLPEALESGRPTLIEFYAPWCISCKESAPYMLKLEKRYGDRINFVTINGDDQSNAELVRLFGVDGVPHLALIGSDRKLKGTLIGEVPQAVVERSCNSLAEGRPLPYGEEAAS